MSRGDIQNPSSDSQDSQNIEHMLSFLISPLPLAPPKGPPFTLSFHSLSIPPSSSVPPSLLPSFSPFHALPRLLDYSWVHIRTDHRVSPWEENPSSEEGFSGSGQKEGFPFDVNASDKVGSESDNAKHTVARALEHDVGGASFPGPGGHANRHKVACCGTSSECSCPPRSRTWSSCTHAVIRPQSPARIANSRIMG
jgi:hypothetical protein